MAPYIYIGCLVAEKIYWYKFGIFTSGKFTGEIMQTRLNEL